MSSTLIERINDINSVWIVYPEKIKLIVDSYKDKSGENYCEECNEIIKKLLKKTFPEFKEEKKFSSDVIKECDEILGDEFTIYGEKVKMYRNGNGCYDWHTKGESGDYNWGLLFNRHEYFDKLIYAYNQTGNKKYIDKIDEIIKNWVIANPKPGFRSHEDLEWNERPWRTLEVAIRLKVWIRVFYTVGKMLSPATCVFLISGILEHCHHIMNFTAWPEHEYPNIYATEMLALAFCGVYFPEFVQSEEWISFAEKAFYEDIIEKQVYPDGVHKEMSSGYHIIAARDFEEIFSMFKCAGRDNSEKHEQILVSMWDFTAKTLKPDGTLPQNGDTDVVDASVLIKNKAQQYGHPEWINYDKNVVFPWGGISIIRDKDMWSFFDIGPHGTSGHGHRDKLHFSLYYKRDILVDSGRYLYNFDKWLEYYRDGTKGHNTILINGASQCKGEEEQLMPVTSFGENWAEGEFTGGYFSDKENNNIPIFNEIHKRRVEYTAGGFIITDTIETSGCEVEMPWHFHPCALCSIGNAVYTNDKNTGNVLIIPPKDFSLEIVSGLEEPCIQGWYSKKYGEKTASPTAVYKAVINQTKSFEWKIILFDDSITDNLKSSIKTMCSNL